MPHQEAYLYTPDKLSIAETPEIRSTPEKLSKASWALSAASHIRLEALNDAESAVESTLKREDIDAPLDATKRGLGQFVRAAEKVQRLELIKTGNLDEQLISSIDRLSHVEPTKLQELLEMAWQLRQESSVDIYDVTTTRHGGQSGRGVRHIVHQDLLEQGLESYTEKYGLTKRNRKVLDSMLTMDDDELETAWRQYQGVMAAHNRVEAKRRLVPQKLPKKRDRFPESNRKTPAESVDETELRSQLLEAERDSIVLSEADSIRHEAMRVLFTVGGLDRRSDGENEGLLKREHIGSLAESYTLDNEDKSVWATAELKAALQTDPGDERSPEEIGNDFETTSQELMYLAIGRGIYESRDVFGWRNVIKNQMFVTEMTLSARLGIYESITRRQPTRENLIKLGRMTYESFENILNIPGIEETKSE